MLDAFRQTLRDLLSAARTPEARREVLDEMKSTLVQTKVGVADLHGAAELTRKRLAHERHELETVQRRKQLALGINDAETVTVAERFERVHLERVAVYERKLEVQLEEMALAERELEAMTAELKRAVKSGGIMPPGPQAQANAEVEDAVHGERLREDIDGLARAHRQASRNAAADEMLDALKRRMGK